MAVTMKAMAAVSPAVDTHRDRWSLLSRLGDRIISRCLRAVGLADVGRVRRTCRRLHLVEPRSYMPAVLAGSFDAAARQMLLVVSVRHAYRRHAACPVAACPVAACPIPTA